MKKRLAVPLVVVAAASSAGLVARGDIDRSWASMANELDALTAVREALPGDRPARYGETTDGRAWSHYEEALAVLADPLEVRRRALSAHEARHTGERDRLVGGFAATFDPLRRGAHARDARSNVDWDVGLPDALARGLPALAVVELSVARSRTQLARGEDREAIESMLDAQQLARDLVASPCLVEAMAGLSGLAPDSLLRALAAGELRHASRAAQLEWLEGMRRLERSLPDATPALRGGVEMFGRSLRRTVVPTAPVVPGREVRWTTYEEPGWRNRYSWRHAGADFVERAIGRVELAEASLRRPPAEAWALCRELSEDWRADANPLLARHAATVESVSLSWVRCVGQLAFLRHALALHLGVDDEPPQDPFGNGVRVERTGAGVRVHATTAECGPIDVFLPAADDGEDR